MEPLENVEQDVAQKTQITIDPADSKKLYQELRTLNTQNLLIMYNSWPKLLFVHFMKGAAFGLGSVIGASIVVSILAYLLSQIEFIPILGEWIKSILQELEKQAAP